MSDLNALYGQLREADRMAQAGDEQAKTDAKNIYDRIQQVKAEEARLHEAPPLLGAVAGANAGVPISTGYGGYKAYEFAKNTGVADAIKGWAANQAAKAPPPPSTSNGIMNPNANPTWTKAMSGIAPPGSQMNKESLDIANRMVETVGPRGEMPGGSIYKDSVIVPPDIKAQAAENAARRAQAVAQSQPINRVMSQIKNLGSAAGSLYKPVAKIAGPVLGGASAGYGALDTMNRYNRDDNLGAALSALETTAGLASMYPPAAPVALPISYGAGAANWARDEYLKRRGQPQTSAEQQPAVPMAVGGLVYLR